MSTPIRRTRSPCGARAASGHAAAPPSGVMKSRRFMLILHPLVGERASVGLELWGFASKFAELIRRVSAHCRGAPIPGTRDSARELHHRLAVRHIQCQDNVIVAGCHIGAK